MATPRKKLKTRLPAHERKLKKFLRQPGFSVETLENRLPDFTFSSLVEASVISVANDVCVLRATVDGTPIEAHLNQEERVSEQLSAGDTLWVTVRKNTAEPKEPDTQLWVASEVEALQLKAYQTIPAEGAEEKVTGLFLSRSGNGYSVALNVEDVDDVSSFSAVRAYAPMRHAVHERDIRMNLDLHGKKDAFIVHAGTVAQDNLIVSRREALKTQQKEKEEHIWESIQVGQRVTGIVKNLTRYGAFIDIGGVDGLLHQQDISWSGRARVDEVVKRGERIETQIIDIDKDVKKIKLGLKQLLPDPWTQNGQSLSIGQNLTGHVVSLTDYGAFVEISEGLEGLVHVSELSWQPVKHPSQMLELGQEIEVKVLDLDLSERRVSLSLKALEDNPYTVFKAEHPEGSIVTGIVTSITDFGAFVRLNEHIDGLVHLGEFSWTERIDSASDKVSVGEEIQVKVVEVNVEDGKVSCSIKRLEEDPTEGWRTGFPVGSRKVLTVTQLTENHAIVDVGDPQLTGVIKKRELSTEPVNRVIDVVKVGDEVECEVLELNTRQQQLYLSIRRAQEHDTKEAYDAYKNKEGQHTEGFSMADALSESVKKELNIDAES